MNESLAILLPVHNAQQSLPQTVSRALEIATEISPRCEIVIIDDGSTDGTEEIACDLALEFPQVLVARHHQHRGLDEAIHTGVQATHGSILIIVPPGAELRPGEVRQLWTTGAGISPADETSANHEGATSKPSTLIARLTKWGQALREESAVYRSGPRMVRRELYRRRKTTRQFQPTRVDEKSTPAPISPPNMLTQLRDFALGE